MRNRVHQPIIFIFLLSCLVSAYAFPANSGCPLDFSTINFTELASACSSHKEGTCCRYLHAIVGIALSRYAKTYGDIGAHQKISAACVRSLSSNLTSNGISPNAALLCGLGTKISFDVQCKDVRSLQEMEDASMFSEMQLKCKNPISSIVDCQRCLDASIIFIRHFMDSVSSNAELSICGDATFVAISRNDDVDFALKKARCFFGILDLQPRTVIIKKIKPFFEIPSPTMPPAPEILLPYANSDGHFHSTSKTYHWTIIIGSCSVVLGISFMFILVIFVLIKRKREELKGNDFSYLKNDVSESYSQTQKWVKARESGFRCFSYKEVRRATNDFSTLIGQGGFGSIYKGMFENGVVAAVRHIVSTNHEEEEDGNGYIKEIECLGRLHHRHLIALKGYCIKHGRFLIYEYMDNGSLKEHLHDPMKNSMSWTLRLQIAGEIAVGLEYLHHYCDPPLCHGTVKSSNVLLDKNFVVKGKRIRSCQLSSNSSQIPDYIDPHSNSYQEQSIKSDIYCYGVILLEVITGKEAAFENMSLVEWAQNFIFEESRWPQLIDPRLSSTYNTEELKHIVNIIKMCIQLEWQARPSIRRIIFLFNSQLGFGSPDTVRIEMEKWDLVKK